MEQNGGSELPNIDDVVNAIAAAEATGGGSLTTNRALLETQFPVFQPILDQMRAGIDPILDEFNSRDLLKNKDVKEAEAIRSAFRAAISNDTLSGEVLFIYATFENSTSKQNLVLEVKARTTTPDKSEAEEYWKVPADHLCFWIESSVRAEKIEKIFRRSFFVKNDGSLTLRDDSGYTPYSVQEWIDFVKGYLYDTQLWTALSK